MNNWERFDKRSGSYDLYRPRYPDALLDLLQKETELNRNSTVADIGSGTGLLSELLLKSGCRLYCIEPNEEMRKVALSRLAEAIACKVVEGNAEATSLPPSSIDLITAGQAFHWFDRAKSKDEFKRILKKEGKVALVWNTRVESSNGPNFEYERLVKKYSKEYHASGSKSTDTGAIREFFNDDPRFFKIKNHQKLDYLGMLGRYLSSSYAISESDPAFGRMKREFAEVFENQEKDGYITIEYETEAFIGTIDR